MQADNVRLQLQQQSQTVMQEERCYPVGDPAALPGHQNAGMALSGFREPSRFQQRGR